MSNKYISQLNSENFVFPNNTIAEYDIDLLQNINDYSVSGTVTNFAVSGTARTTGFTISHDWTWSRNNADTFVSSNGDIHLFSIHMMAAGQTYYKPWRCVDYQYSTFDINNAAGTNTAFISPDMMGLTTFVSGTYYFEIRMIGLKSIYPICQTLSITVT